MAFSIERITPVEARELGIPEEVTVFGPVPVRKTQPEKKTPKRQRRDDDQKER